MRIYLVKNYRYIFCYGVVIVLKPHLIDLATCILVYMYLEKWFPVIVERRGRDKLILSKLSLPYETKCYWYQKYYNGTKIEQFQQSFYKDWIQFN